MTILKLDVPSMHIINSRNKTRETILNNEKIEERLNVIVVVSNPCLFKKRYVLAKEFLKRMEREEDVEIYVVELVYGDEPYYLTEPNKKNHLQLRTETPLWHKENMINLGIKKLLPPTWKAVAWIDADIEFDSPHWASDTLKILNGYKDIVQLFTHALDMDKDCYTMQTFAGFGYQYETGKKYVGSGPDFWHPGYAWACTRKAYEKMGGLYELSILGSGDHNMALSFIGNGIKSVNKNVSEDYTESVLRFEKKVLNFRMGYVPGIIRHYFHGSKANRKYTERWKILTDSKYSPTKHIERDESGLLIPSKNCPKTLLTDIMSYFRERNEDE